MSVVESVGILSHGGVEAVLVLGRQHAAQRRQRGAPQRLSVVVTAPVYRPVQCAVRDSVGWSYCDCYYSYQYQFSPELGVEAEVAAVGCPPHGLAAGQVPDQLEVGGGDEGGRREGGEVVPAALRHLRPAVSNSAVTTLDVPCVLCCFVDRHLTSSRVRR